MPVVPKPKKELIMYLSASYGAISAVLMTERDTIQTPVYFVSRALQATPMEKLVLALVCAAKRAVTKMECHARGTQHHNRPRTSVKGQILADFLIEKPDDAPPEASILIEVLKEKSIQEREVATVVEEEGPTWMTPIIEYLRDETLLEDRKEASKLRIKARQYELLEGILYRRSFLNPWLRCIGPLQADYVIWEIHEGSCSMHAGPGSVVAKAMRSGYYWPTMHRDAREMIHKWIDIAGPFPEGPGKVKFLIVAMDYFTKWIEAKVVAIISGSQVKKFVWDNISNRLIERENRSLGEGIKAHLGEGNKNWLEELPHVLWPHRMMIKSSNDDTPFSLTYGTEAVIPVEIGMPMYRTAVVDVVHNDEELRLNLDLLKERRERAAICEAKAKLNMTKYYNARVRGVTFRMGDFVYRSNDASHVIDGGKLSLK
ncbi:reverse transcriptase domain-containing protein [Tanacetum coccineum]